LFEEIYYGGKGIKRRIGHNILSTGYHLIKHGVTKRRVVLGDNPQLRTWGIETWMRAEKSQHGGLSKKHVGV